ncbi:hypothetical protein BRADI_1g40666v3 [Brachypodium distachyon]|uniref:Uncharacterized protein n=1 Tax=Brachypodium distachyon TaxID=15368 RepID=A0A2K2DNQ0_BRADI|nr:hypothetical protein BRADI_1g40666v3 [Brachypodium distachyon]
MKIDAAQHVATLDNAIGKTKLFHIGMKVDSTSRFPISYVIRKSFSADNGQMLPSTEVTQSIFIHLFRPSYNHITRNY